jgi:ubiquinone/menaquinone biosynthesis C-methylase UbiE
MWEQKALENGMDPGLAYQDLNIRQMEIETVSKYIAKGSRVLDVGCGNGYSLKFYARRLPKKLVGIDFSPMMIQNAKKMVSKEIASGTVEVRVGDATNLSFPDGSFDLVISTRCLINLATWDLQKRAIAEAWRILKPGGRFVMLESSQQGLAKMNELRERVGLYPIVSPWHDLNLDEKKLDSFLRKYFRTLERRSFGLFFFVSRLVHPMLVRPEEPKYDAKINEVAREVQLRLKDDPFRGVGHLFLLVLSKK